MGRKPPYNRHNWPIAAGMNQYPNTLPDGSSVQDQRPEEWALAVQDVADAGFTEIDPTDSWIRLADLEPVRRREFLDVVKGEGLTIPAITTARRSIIDPEHGDEYFAYMRRVIDVAAEIGAAEVSIGFSRPFNDQQKKALWFWTTQGPKDPDDPAIWKKAVDRIKELGRQAAALKIGISLEIYEDTYLGSAESAVRFTQDVDLPNVGINADIGNLVRLHRPMTHWRDMMVKLAPYARYWHVKNYLRTEDEDSGLVVTAPAPMETGVISYREAIRMAIAHGFQSAFLCEHYGGDGLSVSARNREYLRRILPK
ncbi:AP endonuclease, family protein 2 [Acetobacteraceae bacterium EV16G]|uniref:AP endonuclease, family protein 2 n=1 Tax=Sorlinia euscelidii TaxID=3081148 RepID=A0ABU7U362_9PROT